MLASLDSKDEIASKLLKFIIYCRQNSEQFVRQKTINYSRQARVSEYVKVLGQLVE